MINFNIRKETEYLWRSMIYLYKRSYYFYFLALIWIGVVVVPGAFLIDSITNSFIYRRLYVAITYVVGGVLIAIIVAKVLLLKLLLKK